MKRRYVCTSGLHWIARGRIEADGRPRAIHHAEALDFARLLLDAPIHQIALENPVGAIGSKIRAATQSIQPYNFGEDASKRTCLWLKNFPPLRATKHIPPRYVCQDCGFTLYQGWAGDACACGSIKFRPRWANQTDSGQNKLPPSDTRGHDRSLTYQGIADAMADQWT